MAITKAQEIPPQHEVELLYIEGVITLEQVAHGGHEVFLSRDVQNPPGHVTVSLLRMTLLWQRGWTG